MDDDEKKGSLYFTSTWQGSKIWQANNSFLLCKKKDLTYERSLNHKSIYGSYPNMNCAFSWNFCRCTYVIRVYLVIQSKNSWFYQTTGLIWKVVNQANCYDCLEIHHYKRDNSKVAYICYIVLAGVYKHLSGDMHLNFFSSNSKMG
jgi:hypothetical protein